MSSLILQSTLSNKVAILRNKKNVNILFKRHISREFVYGVFRSEITNYIRSYYTKACPLAIHASCINWKNENYVIIGKKGSGKSSSSLYLKEKGANIFTDEFVFFDIDFYATCLNRYIAITERTQKEYFESLKQYNIGTIESLFNTEKKFLMNLTDREQNPLKIDKFIILVREGAKNFSLTEKLKIITSQSVSNHTKLSREFIYYIANNSILMTINDIQRMK